MNFSLKKISELSFSDNSIYEALESLSDINVNYCLMITEDEEDYRFLIELGFKQIGFSGKIVTTSNGEELMNYLLRQKSYKEEIRNPTPDFILLDNRMPKKDGRQVLKEIKSNKDLMNIPVIVLTANQIDREADEFKEIGALDYAVKPSSAVELKKTFKSILSHWRQVVSG